MNGRWLYALRPSQSTGSNHVYADPAAAVATAVTRTVPPTIPRSPIPRETRVTRCSNKITPVVGVVVAPTVIMVTYIRKLDFDDNQSVDGGRLVCSRSAIDRVVSRCFEGVFFATAIKAGVSITVICNGKKAPVGASPFACDINPPIYIRALNLGQNPSRNRLSRNVPGTTVKIIKICCIILLLNKF
nr:MAG TPA: hypothetical protein [Caudoviricetes sp.]